MAQLNLRHIEEPMVGMSSRLAVVFCGIITVFLSRFYKTFAGFDAYTRTRTPWSAFSVGLISIGALAIMLAFVPSAWITGSHEVEKRVHAAWSLPIKLLTVFAVCAYLGVVGLYFAPHGWTLAPAFAFILCPACVLTITVDPSFTTVALLLAPLSAAVYGSLGSVFGFLGLIVENRKRR